MTDHWTEPACGYRGDRPTIAVTPGDHVTLCTASYTWTVGNVDTGVLLLPVKGDKWRGPLTVHRAHLDHAAAQAETLFDAEEATA